MTWNGIGLEGVRFKEHRRGDFAIHYTYPTSWATAERLRETAAALVHPGTDWGLLAESERLRIWILPRGQLWPDGLPMPVTTSVRAVAPYTIVIREEAIRPDRELIVGLAEALALALTQPYDSPVWQTGWLHEGMGRI